MTPEERDKRLVPDETVETAVKSPTPDEWMAKLYELPTYDQMLNDIKNRNGGPVIDIFTKYTPKPEQKITPEQAKRAKTAAAISDSLATLAQMFAYSQGARVRNPQGKTSQQTTNERLQAMQDKYEQDMLRYNAAYGNAAMQDWQQMLQGSMSDRNQIRENILYQAQRAQQIEQAKAKAAADEAKYVRETEDKKAAAKLAHERALQLARVRNASRSGGGRGNTIAQPSPIYIKTSANDPDAQQDAFGNYVKPVYLSKEQISLYGNMAIKDKDFNQHIKSSGVSLGEFDDDGKWVKGNIDGNQMAHMYLQWLNDNKNKPEPYSYLSPEDLGVGVPELKQQKSYKSGTPVKRTTAPEWKIPKANLANPNKSAGQPRFNHSPY